jgi:type I restriction enzyme R subunit
LDRAGAKEAVREFIADRQLTADQPEFLVRIIDARTETGFVDPKNFYESPFIDIDSQGIVGVSSEEPARQIIEVMGG